MTAERDPLSVPRRRGPGARTLFALLILAFIGGALGMAWMARKGHWLDDRRPSTASQPAGADLLDSASADNGASAPALSEPMDAAHVADLEQRMARISLAAQAASYNANRAEALLTAFAARRALDEGRPLGYVEGTLRLRFGEAQPKAVATIVNAAAEPVTLADLRLGLEDINPVARDPRQGGSWWGLFWHELGSMAVIRRVGEPSPEPAQRLIRAQRAIDLGHIDAAIGELAALPSQPAVIRWLELARRYAEAHRALDVVEAAAILEPRATPGVAAPATSAAAVVPVPPAPPSLDNTAGR